MFRLLRELHRSGLLTFIGVLRLVEAMFFTGVNPMALLRTTARLHPRRTALTDDEEALSYQELWTQAESVAVALHFDRGVRHGQKVAIACRDHVAAVKAIFAASRLGAHVYLVSPELSSDQVTALDERLRFDLYVHDAELAPVFSDSPISQRAISAYHPTDVSIAAMSSRQLAGKERLKKAKAGKLVVMTGGTTGAPKSASRKPSIFTFLPPFCALLTQVHLGRYRSVYIATPFYHGFGLASLFIGVILGVTMHVSRRFKAENACSLIESKNVEVLTVVPLMLQRMLNRDAAALSSLRCIVSGGAALSPVLARRTLQQVGPVLFNMYGTSEAGFCIMATPEMLARKPESIGRPVAGVRARIVDEANQIVERTCAGQLCIRSAWTTSSRNWVETGDIAYRDPDGDLFLCGRVDDMIVSGGENVYPIELENVLAQHPAVDTVAVVGIPDAEFGQRLKAVVKMKDGTPGDPSTLLEWLKPRVARYQMPAVIEFRDELPYTQLGKLDKKAL